MAPIDLGVVEMPSDDSVGFMPPYRRLISWIETEVAGLTDEQLDLDDLRPKNEWMWWSIRRQVSHIAWDSLVFTSRRCGALLWPDGDVPAPIAWDRFGLGTCGTRSKHRCGWSSTRC